LRHSSVAMREGECAEAWQQITEACPAREKQALRAMRSAARLAQHVYARIDTAEPSRTASPLIKAAVLEIAPRSVEEFAARG